MGLREYEVIGVTRDVRTLGLDKPAPSMLYVQNVFPYSNLSIMGDAIVIRTAMNPVAAAVAAREIVHDLDPQVPITSLQPMTDVVAESVATRRFQMLLVALFAACALFLAGLGVFGVVSYSVEQRRHELGIRMALGAQLGNLKRMILRQGMWPVMVGLAAGLTVAALSGRLIQNLLFGIEPSNSLTMICVVTIVALVGVAACYVPARRVTKLDPLIALRAE
jgi:putative ABC transport system permease protein